jgi:hypothetical protein
MRQESDDFRARSGTNRVAAAQGATRHGARLQRDPRASLDPGATMSDDTSKRGPADRQRVNVDEDYEVRYWTQKWNVSEARLREAVAAAGVMADDVEAWLRR